MYCYGSGGIVGVVMVIFGGSFVNVWVICGESCRVRNFGFVLCDLFKQFYVWGIFEIE